MHSVKNFFSSLPSHLPGAPTGRSNVPNSYGSIEGLQVLPPDASKIEPKVWLASERTFLNWLRVALLLSSFALALFNASGPRDYVGRWMGFAYAVISIIILGYAYTMQKRRRERIITRYAGSHDELVGPLVICVLIFLAVLVNFILRVHSREATRDKPTPKNPWARTVEVLASAFVYQSSA